MSTPMSILVAVMATFGTPAMELDPDEVFCLTQNIYFESSIERRDGKSAVAHVTLNRVQNRRYPDTVCGVVWQNRQFSWTQDGKSDRIPLHDARRREQPWVYEAWIESAEVAVEALLGQSPDPTDGANYYYAHRLVTPSWSRSFTVAAVIGNHTFMRRPRGS
ncbi:MAG: cell wall hydrolase [Inquilinus sp.]|nr:cell wall hydrolase [Inquilinus sp.]